MQTPLGEFNFSKNFWVKISADERKKLFGLIKPTMTNAEYIIIDDNYATLFLKAFNKKGNKIYVGVIGSKYRHIISFHPKGNLKNKIKSGKLLIYQSERVRKRGAGSPDSFVELSDSARNLSFNFDDNIKNTKQLFNEVWGEFVSPGDFETLPLGTWI